MTNNLGTARIADGQASGQWATSNDADGAHDAAMTETLTVVFDSTSETLTALQFISNFTFNCTAGSPAPGAACTLNVPSTNAESATLKRGAFTVINGTGQDLTVQVSGQSTTPPTLENGQASILVMDGSDVRLAVPQGSVGGDGADGVDAGIRWTFDTGTTTADDPGTGDLRLNNATLSSVTEIGLDDNSSEAGNPDVSAWLTTWDDSTSSVKGYVIIKKTSAPENFAIYTVTAGTDATTHWRMTVSHVASSGSFSSADVLSVQFVPKGDIGAGSTIAVEDSDQSPSVINAATETIIFGDNLTVADNGDGSVTVTGSAGGGTFSGALVYKAADETSADYSAGATVPFTAEVYDTDSYHDNATNNSRLTIPSGVSRVRLAASVQIGAHTSDTYVRATIQKNGANVTGSGLVITEISDALAYLSMTTAVLSCTAGDYFELWVDTESDTSVTLLGGLDTGLTWLSIEKVE